MKSSAGLFLVLSLMLSTVLLVPASGAGPRAFYEGGTDTVYTPKDINSSGLVVGNAQAVEGGGYFAFAWQPGGPLTVIGQAGDPGWITPRWHVEDVNDAGQAVGWYRWWDAGIGHAMRAAFLWTEESGAVLLEYPAGMNQCFANRINNAGQIAGVCCDAFTEDSACTAFLWNPDGEIVSLGTLGGAGSEPVDINEWGVILGHSFREGMYARSCFVWYPDEGMVDLGDLGDGYCSPLDINDLGQVTAVSTMSGKGTQGVIWDDAGGMRWIDPGETGSFYPYRINNAGDVAGVLYAPSYDPDAARWTRDGGLVILNHPGEMMAAVDMNEAGVVLVEDRSKVESLAWTPEKGLKNLSSPGRMATLPVAVNDSGLAVGSFTRRWHRKPAERGMVVWETGKR